MKYDPTEQYLPPQKYQKPTIEFCTREKVIHGLIAEYRAQHPGEMPLTKWLMEASGGMSSGTVSNYRKTYFSKNEKTVANIESESHSPC